VSDQAKAGEGRRIVENGKRRKAELEIEGRSWKRRDGWSGG